MNIRGEKKRGKKEGKEGGEREERGGVHTSSRVNVLSNFSFGC